MGGHFRGFGLPNFASDGLPTGESPVVACAHHEWRAALRAAEYRRGKRESREDVKITRRHQLQMVAVTAAEAIMIRSAAHRSFTVCTHADCPPARVYSRMRSSRGRLVQQARHVRRAGGCCGGTDREKEVLAPALLAHNGERRHGSRASGGRRAVRWDRTDARAAARLRLSCLFVRGNCDVGLRLPTRGKSPQRTEGIWLWGSLSEFGSQPLSND